MVISTEGAEESPGNLKPCEEDYVPSFTITFTCRRRMARVVKISGTPEKEEQRERACVHDGRV